MTLTWLTDTLRIDALTEALILTAVGWTDSDLTELACESAASIGSALRTSACTIWSTDTDIAAVVWTGTYGTIRTLPSGVTDTLTFGTDTITATDEIGYSSDWIHGTWALRIKAFDAIEAGSTDTLTVDTFTLTFSI